MVFLLLNEFQVDIKSDEVMRGQVLSADPMTLTQIFLRRVKIMKLTRNHIILLFLPYPILHRMRAFKLQYHNNIDSILLVKKSAKCSRIAYCLHENQ